MKTKRNFKTAGFTLIELLVALTIVSIGLAITVPAMKDFTDTNRQVEQINKFVRDITFAKSEAVTRGETVCVRSASGNAVWDGGWRIEDTAVPPIVIRTATTTAIVGQTLASTAGLTSVCFRADGSITQAFTAEQCKACVHANNPNSERQISVGNTGRITLESNFQCLPAAPAC